MTAGRPHKGRKDVTTTLTPAAIETLVALFGMPVHAVLRTLGEGIANGISAGDIVGCMRFAKEIADSKKRARGPR